MENLPTILFNAENRTLQFKLYNSEGTAVLDLTGMTIAFSLGDASTTPIVTGTMTLTTANAGECEFTLSPSQLTSLGSGRFRYSIRQTAPTNRVLQYGQVTVNVTF